MRRLQRLPATDRLPPRHRLLPLLGLLLLVVLAGCSAAGSITMEPVTDAEVAERASRGIDPAGAAEDDPEARTIRSAIENGSGTIEAQSPPVRDGRPFEYLGTYYDLSWEVVEERTATSVSFVVDYNATDPGGRRIAYEDLPAADRRALSSLIPPEERHGDEDVSMGAVSTYNDSAVESSVLVPEPRYDVVVSEGEAYPVRLDGTREVTVNTYRYTAEVVANSSEEYARDLKEEYLFTLSGLSEQERSLVETAIEDGYYAEDREDETFRSVVQRFTRHEAIEPGDTYGDWLVRYDGETYWAHLEYGGIAMSDSSAMSGSGTEPRG